MTVPETEAMRMTRWREAVCRELRCEPAVVAAVVALELDAHDFRALVEAGCDPAIAVEILRP